MKIPDFGFRANLARLWQDTAGRSVVAWQMDYISS